MTTPDLVDAKDIEAEEEVRPQHQVARFDPQQHHGYRDAEV